MRKTVIAIMVAVFALAAGTAIAASTKADSGSVAFSSNKAGTKKSPHAIGYTLHIDTTATGSNQPQVTREVKLKIYGMKVDGKHFPTCTSSQIAAAHTDAGCPKGAMVGSGAIQATLVGTGAPAACDPNLHVWNSGQGKLTYYFTTDSAHMCLGGALMTGSTPPYGGTYKMQGGYFMSDVKIPNAINYPTAGLTGLLYHEHLFFSSQTRKVHGKKYTSQEVTGCKKGKRPWQLQVITAPMSQGTGGAGQTSTTKGSSSCA